MERKELDRLKHHLRIALFGAGTVVALIGAGALSLAAGTSSTSPEPTAVTDGGSSEPIHSRPLLPTVEAARSHARGVPAIQPRERATDGMTPAFGVQEVLEYVKARPISDRASRDAAVTVETVEFLPRRAFPQRYPQLRPLTADDTLLCVVKLRGTFVMSAPPSIRQNTGLRTADTAHQVFDARTGNLLLEAVGP